MRVSNLLAIALCGLIVACAANNAPTGTGAVAANAGALPAANEGVVLLNTAFVGRGCGQQGTVVIGQKSGKIYRAIQKIESRDRDDDVQLLRVKAGTYHVVGAGCRFSAGGKEYTLSVGKKDASDIFSKGGDYKHSYATFSVASGEVINAGLLKVRSGALGPSLLAVDAIPQGPLMRFHKSNPELASRLKTRLMRIDRQPIDGKKRNRLCKAIRKLRKVLPQAAKKIPAECQDLQTAAKR